MQLGIVENKIEWYATVRNGVQNTQTLASSATKEYHESVPPSERDIATVLATTVHTQRQ